MRYAPNEYKDEMDDFDITFTTHLEYRAQWQQHDERIFFFVLCVFLTAF